MIDSSLSLIITYLLLMCRAADMEKVINFRAAKSIDEQNFVAIFQKLSNLANTHSKNNNNNNTKIEDPDLYRLWSTIQLDM